MAEEPLMAAEPGALPESQQEIVPTELAGEPRSPSNFSVDRRARLALDLAAFAVEHSVESGRDAIMLGRQLRSVADACTQATVLASGLVGRTDV